MNYKLLSQDEQDEILVNTLRAQERDHFCYAANVERYTNALTTLPPGPKRDYIAALLVTETEAMDHQSHIVNHTQKQMPPQARVDAALARILAKEAKL